MASLDEFAREKVILGILQVEDSVAVTELARRFGVSAVTIRKDLETLERRRLVRRIRGGAVGVGTSDEGAFEMRLRHSKDAKSAIARAVAPLIRDGDVIAIDSSTTTYFLAQEIVDRRDLVVVTTGLRHALLFMENSTARVLMPGGVVRRSSSSLVGPIGNVLAGRGRIRAGFFGAVGISTVHGLMDISAEEAQTKRFMSDACDRIYGLFDSSKLSGFGLHPFVDADRITAMYTDDESVTLEHVMTWKEFNVPLNAVPVERHGSERSRKAALGPTN